MTCAFNVVRLPRLHGACVQQHRIPDASKTNDANPDACFVGPRPSQFPPSCGRGAKAAPPLLRRLSAPPTRPCAWTTWRPIAAPTAFKSAPKRRARGLVQLNRESLFVFFPTRHEHHVVLNVAGVHRRVARPTMRHFRGFDPWTSTVWLVSKPKSGFPTLGSCPSNSHTPATQPAGARLPRRPCTPNR